MNNDNELAPDSIVVDWKDSKKEFEQRLPSENGWRICRLDGGKVTFLYEMDLTNCHVLIKYQRNMLPGISVKFQEIRDNDFS